MKELIEAAKAVIARWDSTDWKAAPTAETMNRLRAALSAKPEPVNLPEVPIGSEADVKDWLQYNHRYERDGRATKYTKVFDYKRVEHYLQEIAAAHAAELAMKDIEIRRLQMVEDAVNHELVTIEASIECYPSPRDAVKRLLDWHSEVAIDPLVSSEARALIEQGRREALAYNPPIPADIKGRVQAEWFWKGVLAMKESARAAQQEVK